MSAQTITMPDADLWHMLSNRRRELQDRVVNRLRDARSEQSAEGCDELERSDTATHEDLEFALLQMNAQTLSRINTAFAQLEAGRHGRCAECDADIAKERLRALPFAVRCKMCEERREHEAGRRTRARRAVYSDDAPI